MVRLSAKGDFSKTFKFLEGARHLMNIPSVLEKYGQRGVDALSAATPLDTGKTASSWYYEVRESKDSYQLLFSNSNVNKGVPIAIILQYGHGTRNGGYVEGRDYINPALQPIFDELADKVWKEVAGR